MNLYFIALIPDDLLRAQVKALKEEMHTRFGAKHALKSPAHITLQMPFRRPDTEEAQIINVLQQFAQKEASFSIDLSGFDCFAPRVLFLRVVDHAPICALHARLHHVLIHQLGFAPTECNTRMHPHMTIATRDLRKAAFADAWPVFQTRDFTASFVAKDLFLLKHNGRYWDIHQAFPFAAQSPKVD